MNWERLFNRRKRPAAKLPEFLPILEELARAFDAITEEDLERCNLRLGPAVKGEVKLGVVHSQEARRICAVANQMAHRCREAKLYADSQAQGDDEVQYHWEKGQRFDALEDVARALFWMQAKDDIGGKVWRSRAVALREGWMLVSTNPRPPQAMIEMLGGHFPGME